MDANRLFIETLDDLEGRAVPGASEYSLVRAAGLLRELLADEAPLVLQVNRKWRYRLLFRLRDPETHDRNQWWFGMNTEGAFPPGGQIHEVGVKEFLAFPIAYLDDTNLTIKDLVLIGANVLGGIHLGVAKTPAARANERYPMKIAHGTTPFELVAMVSITEALLRGLDDLRKAVREALPPLPERGGRVAITGRSP